MSAQDPPPPRHAQGEELIAAIRNNTRAIVALTTAVGALALVVGQNTAAVREALECDDEDMDDEEEECPDCGDPECDGECEPPRRRRR